MYIPNLSVVCFFICLSYFIFYCALLLFCAQAWHGKTLSSRNDPNFFCSLHWRNLSLYNKITTTHFKQIRFWWKNVIQFRGKVYSNFFKFVQQLFFLSVGKNYFVHLSHVCMAHMVNDRWLVKSYCIWNHGHNKYPLPTHTNLAVRRSTTGLKPSNSQHVSQLRVYALKFNCT